MTGLFDEFFSEQPPKRSPSRPQMQTAGVKRTNSAPRKNTPKKQEKFIPEGGVQKTSIKTTKPVITETVTNDGRQAFTGSYIMSELKKPDSLAKYVIIGEILNRPKFRR